MSLRSKALVVLTSQVRHVCPYKAQDVTLALCYIRSQDVEQRDFCYGCDHIDNLKEKFGLRTFKRRLVFSTCKHCYEAATLHEKDEPHKGTRTACPGFEPHDDEGLIFVPTNLECTEWMVVNVVTGERLAYVDYVTARSGEQAARRFHLPLLGAPGTVLSDSRDDVRIEAAAYAEKHRRGYGSARQDNDELPTTIVRKRRQTKKKEK